MSLEDAIVYYSETAKECRRKARIESNDYMDMKDRAYEAEQLADWLNELKVLRERIDAQPTIEQRKTGKWIKNSNGTYSCDKCHSWIPNEQHYYANFCLYCGAVMIGGEECTKKI